ncbi:guanitoxin biosynthesis MBL fold metallo-hydrolase GntH [Streptomyces sp. NPDC093089]|uniref:guanitoxin biosynthesis MBL fold metallo-hydrolase GntH n=1 Tax=Streptomyces sp. NPDC093089 TaxID=3366024 RepID=UPI0038057528
MSGEDRAALPDLTYMGGTLAITTTPVVGTPAQPYPDVFVPLWEELREGEIRVTVLGSGNPPPTRAQASGSVLVEVGNAERDMFLFDAGSGSLANFLCLKLPVNGLDKVFLSHLHADHTADLITLFGSFRKAGRAGPLHVWGPSGSEPRFGTARAVECIAESCAWDTESTRGFTSNESAQMHVTEFPTAKTHTVYEDHGVTITAFPVVHALDGAVGYRIDYAGLSVVHSGDTRPCWPLVRAAENGVDLLIHECFPSADLLAALTGRPIDKFETVMGIHTVPRMAGKVFSLVEPRMAALWHTMLVPPLVEGMFRQLRTTYEGPVTQTQDLTVFNITKEAVVARQTETVAQAMVVEGEPTVRPTFGERPTPPSWWKDALIPEDAPTVA